MESIKLKFSPLFISRGFQKRVFLPFIFQIIYSTNWVILFFICCSWLFKGIWFWLSGHRSFKCRNFWDWRFFLLYIDVIVIFILYNKVVIMMNCCLGSFCFLLLFLEFYLCTFRSCIKLFVFFVSILRAWSLIYLCLTLQGIFFSKWLFSIRCRGPFVIYYICF